MWGAACPPPLLQPCRAAATKPPGRCRLTGALVHPSPILVTSDCTPQALFLLRTPKQLMQAIFAGCHLGIEVTLRALDFGWSPQNA